LQWTGRESKPQPLGYESDTLPLHRCTLQIQLLSVLRVLRYVTVAVPGQPSNLQGVPVSESAIQLSWDHPAGAGDSIVSYELYFNDSLQRRGVHVTISPPVNTYLLSDLSPDTVYHIRLAAKSLRGEGVPTATIQVRTMEYGIVVGFFLLSCL